MRSARRPVAAHPPLHSIAEALEAVAQARLRLEGRIRALVEEGAEGWRALAASDSPEAILAAIRERSARATVPPLGRAYRRRWEEEAELGRSLAERLEGHPAGSWLERVGGLDALVVAKLVARLDVTRAPTPSSFWSYCGLATVPDPGGAGRRAQPAPAPGERPAFDVQARGLCYRLGAALARSPGPYGEYYRRERAALNASRPGWTETRRHVTALRKTEKLFLLHLWLVWRQALDLSVTQPYSPPEGASARWNDPWEMVAQTPRRRWTRPEPLPPVLRVSV